MFAPWHEVEVEVWSSIRPESSFQIAYLGHTNELNEVLERHHLIHGCCGRAVLFQSVEQSSDRARGGEERADWEDDDAKPQFTQAIVGDWWRLPSLNPVEDQWNPTKGVGNRFDLVLALRRFNEDCVGACFFVPLGAL